ncbi:E3 UFM1-protein ligase 1 [Entomortierella parvispora]|uniref:E3 UFM1-protein ligase 1 n=1 Tax=Entomortierella parvispora TaxID=205924 RepID=A0A9P3HC56_9FUNG|nr:E3 UFM1-protein ligase 1 [Entomortierella parvispora]
MTSAIWKTLFGQADNPDDLQGPASLSEDACADLVHSLLRLGYINDIATGADGKTFITHQQLQDDITLQLEKHNGRVSILDLPKALNATASDIQDRIQDLIRQKSSEFVQVQDELVKVEYLDNLTGQMNTELAQRGYLLVAEQCRKHKFGIDFMRQFLRDRVAQSIEGQWDILDRNLIVAPWFLDQEKSKLRTVFLELTEPATLQTLRLRHMVLDQLFFSLCELLSKEQGLPGAFKGTNEQGTFVPRPYEQQQTEWIETFFRNNGFIELDALRKRGVMDLKGYIQANHSAALLLDTHIVNDSIWSLVDASVEDAISSLSWIDVKPLLPTPLTKEDITSLLRQLPSLAEPTGRIAIASDQDHSLTGLGGGSPQEVVILQGSVVVTSGQFQKCLLRMGPLLDRKAKALFSWRLSFGSNDLIEGQDVAGESSGGYATFKSHFETPLKASGSRKSAKSKSSSESKDSPIKKQLQDFLTIQDVKDEVRDLEPEFDSALVNAVAGALHQELLQNLRERNRSMVLTQAAQDDEQFHTEGTPSTKHINLEVPDIHPLSDNIRLYSNAVDLFEDSSVKNSLSKYLLQTLCVELVDRALLNIAIKRTEPTLNVSKDAIETRERLQSVFKNQADSPPAAAISSEHASFLLEYASTEELESIQKLRKLTAGSSKRKNLVEFLDVWSKLSAKWTNHSDEHMDEQLLKKHMQELRSALTGLAPQSDPALMLHIVTMILFQSWTGTMVHASGKYVPRVLRQLRASVEKNESIGLADKETRRSQLSHLETMLDHILARVKQGPDAVSAADLENDSRLWLDVHALGMAVSSSHLHLQG